MRLRPSVRGRAVMTSSAPAIWGTYLGWTKLTASMRPAPAASSRRVSSARTPGSSTVFSFCRPSRGPTSTIWMGRGLIGGGSWRSLAPGRSIAGQVDIIAGRIVVATDLADRPPGHAQLCGRLGESIGVTCLDDGRAALGQGPRRALGIGQLGGPPGQEDKAGLMEGGDG